MEKEEITSVHRNHSGDIISFQTSNGRIISYRKAIQEAMDGTITGLNLTVSEDGSAFFAPDEFEDYPSFY